MEPLCDYCGVMRGIVYCRSHSAKLCLQCDNCLHDSTNSFSINHDRSLICDKCNSQPATFRCIVDKISLCEGCNWSGNGCSGPGHDLEKLTFYHGCPSLSEFSCIWASVLDPPSKKNDTSISSLKMNDNLVVNTSWDDNDNDNEGTYGQMINRLNEKEICDPLITPYSHMISSNSGYIMPCNRGQVPFVSNESSSPKVNASPNLMDRGINELDGLPKDLEIMLEGGYNNNIEDGCIRDLIACGENLSLTESNCHIENSLEESSQVQGEGVAFQSAWSPGLSTMMQSMSSPSNCFLMNPTWDNNNNLNLGFPGGQVLSTSNITRESSSSDYQDCGLSPTFLTGEALWEPNVEVSFPQARNEAKMRYNEKKKKRMFGKQIRYASRKARADTRKRVKGRFVKAGETDGFDPLVTKGF